MLAEFNESRLVPLPFRGLHRDFSSRYARGLIGAAEDRILGFLFKYRSERNWYIHTQTHTHVIIRGAYRCIIP